MKQNRKVPKPPRDLRAVIHKKPTVFAVYLILRIVVLLTLVSSIIRGEYENAFVCLLVLFLFMLPLFIQQNFGIELPSTLEIIILLFIFASEILGELGCFFITYPNWDSILHTTTGFLCAATGFALIDILNRNSKIKFELSPVYVSLVAFCFSMTIGVLWEFFEFGMDRLFLMDMQEGYHYPQHHLRDAGPHQYEHPGDHWGYHQCGGKRAGAGLWRVPGYRAVRYHGGPVCQFHRGAGL